MENQNYTRPDAEKEAKEDLKKPIEQLLSDIHEETHRNDRRALENNNIAQKRIASMMAMVAESNNKVSNRILFLTIFSIIIGIIQICIAIYKS
ncbi:MAG: hypothetical protein H7321_07515 [Bacteroidia bacterium]|nr:hypothetical protein [Bacteroidia bacterium]